MHGRTLPGCLSGGVRDAELVLALELDELGVGGLVACELGF